MKCHDSPAPTTLHKTEVPLGARQLSGIILRQFITKHWTPDSNSFVEPETCAEDKASIRATLPRLLCDSNSKLQTAASMAIAGILCLCCLKFRLHSILNVSFEVHMCAWSEYSLLCNHRNRIKRFPP